jgi:hypothetical protein
MDKFIVYIDDAEHAMNQLRAAASSGDTQTHWVVVACPPKLSRHAGKWISQSARVSWRNRWASALFSEVKPALTALDGTVQTCVAEGELIAFTKQLRATHGQAPVLDMRRSKFGAELEAVVPGQASTEESRWQLPGAVAGMAAVLVLALE